VRTPRRSPHVWGRGVRRLRESGWDVLLVTPFLPRRRASRPLARRFARFNSQLRGLARSTGAVLLDLEAVPAVSMTSLWADDAVHLNSRGHRLLAYEAAARLGVPDAGPLSRLEQLLHSEEADDEPTATTRTAWLRQHAMPWAKRRLQGRTAGDGRVPKHTDLILIRCVSGSRIDR